MNFDGEEFNDLVMLFVLIMLFFFGTKNIKPTAFP